MEIIPKWSEYQAFNSDQNHNLLLTSFPVQENIIGKQVISRGAWMKLQYSELDYNIRMIKLSGKLELAGTGEIETKSVFS